MVIAEQGVHQDISPVECSDPIGLTLIVRMEEMNSHLMQVISLSQVGMQTLNPVTGTTGVQGKQIISSSKENSVNNSSCMVINFKQCTTRYQLTRSSGLLNMTALHVTRLAALDKPQSTGRLEKCQVNVHTV